MSQIIHILRKDLRRLVPEISNSLAVQALYAAASIGQWKWPVRFGGSGTMFFFDLLSPSNALTGLMLMSWAFLVWSAVHEESLAGDNQFWLTRPYQWQKLLIAKGTLVFVTICLPLVLVQMLMIAHAGFSPLHHLYALLWRQILIPGLGLLAAAIVGAITRNIKESIMTATGMIALIFVWFFLLWVAIHFVPDFGSPYGDWAGNKIEAALFLGVPVAALVWQFARRRTRHTLWLLAGGAAAMLALIAATPYASLTEQYFPALPPGGRPAMRLVLTPWTPGPSEFPELDIGKNSGVVLKMHFLATGLEAETLVRVKAKKIIVDAPGQARWDSGWQETSSFEQSKVLPGGNFLELSFDLKKAYFDRVKALPAKMHITLALTVYRQGRAEQVVAATAGTFPVFGAGSCSLTARGWPHMKCDAPLDGPGNLLVTTVPNFDCKPDKDEIGPDEQANRRPVPPGTVAYSWYTGSQVYEYSIINPMVSFQLSFSLPEPEKGEDKMRRSCPGGPISFYFPRKDRNTRLEVEINNIRLEDYKAFAI